MSEKSESQQDDETIENLRDTLKHFGTADYFVFIAMLLSCTLVGVYFGYEDYMKKKQVKNQRRGSEAMDYLVGGRNMKIFPVAMSLVASCISGIALLGEELINLKLLNNSKIRIIILFLGTSTEIYLYGYQYSFILIGYLMAAYILHHTVIPIFHELQITSAYEVSTLLLY